MATLGDCFSVAEIIFKLCAEVKHRADLVEVNKQSARLLARRVCDIEIALQGRLRDRRPVTNDSLATLRGALESSVELLREMKGVVNYLRRMLTARQRKEKIFQVMTQLQDAVVVVNLEVSTKMSDGLDKALEEDRETLGRLMEDVRAVNDRLVGMRSELVVALGNQNAYMQRLLHELLSEARTLPPREPWCLEIMDFELHEDHKLGKGHFGTVYAGSFRGKPAAIKKIEIRSGDFADMSAFKREMDLMNRIAHPHVVSAYGGWYPQDHDNVNRSPLIVMERLVRGNLEDALYNEPPLSIAERLLILRDIADAMTYMHSLAEPVVHRDLKPSNILLDNEKRGKVADFGLSRSAYLSCSSTLAVAGAPMYMSPEALAGKLSKSNDVWSMGVIIWETFAGQPPVLGLDGKRLGNVGMIIGGIIGGTRILPGSAMGSRCPPAIKDLAKRCTDSDAASRPSFAMVLTVLESCFHQKIEEEGWKRSSLSVLLSISDCDLDHQQGGQPPPRLGEHTDLHEHVSGGVNRMPRDLGIPKTGPLRFVYSNAIEGDIHAQLQLGIRYQYGNGVPQDDLFASSWFHTGLAQGSRRAALLLRDVLSTQSIDSATAKDAQRRAQRVYNNQDWCDFTDDGAGATRWGLVNELGLGHPKNAKIAVEWYMRVAAQGHASGQYNLAECLANGHGVAKDEALAFEWYRRAADQGYACAQVRLGVYFTDEDASANEASSAAEWFQRAAVQGHSIGQYHMADCFERGFGVPRSESTAVKWYKRAAEQGYAPAQSRFGLLLEEGSGLSRNEDAAIVWIQYAALQGCSTAQYNLGRLLWNGNGATKDVPAAVEWYRRAGHEGHPGAQTNFGWCVAKGVYTEKNESEAVQWFRRAADQGLPAAQYNLGVCLARGTGVTKDETAAVAWYRRSADQGYSCAQYNLGICLWNGTGVPRDESAAFQCFRLAALQGDAEAQNTLGRCLQEGVGVSRNRHDAEMWFQRAAEQGHTYAKRNLRACQPMRPEGQPENKRTESRITTARQEQAGANRKLAAGVSDELKVGKDAGVGNWFRRSGHAAGRNSTLHCVDT